MGRQLAWACLVAAAMAACAAVSKNQPFGWTYPASRQLPVVDNYHGVQVPDPYRWLEDLDSPATKKWIAAQNQLTFSFLEKLPQRAAIRTRLAQLWNYERFSVPVARGRRYFYLHNSGLQAQSVLYVSDNLPHPGRVLLDPNTLSADGTMALTGFVPTWDGTLLAYGLSEAGSDWQVWRVREVASGRDLQDELRWVKFSAPAWLPDGSGFFYARYEAPAPGEERKAINFNQKLYFHRLGTSQGEDQLVYARPDHQEWQFSPTVTEDGRFLVIHIHVGTDRRNRVYLLDLTNPQAQVQPLLDAFDASYDFVGNDGETFFFHTDRGSPNGQLVAIALRHPSPEAWKVLIPEKKEVLQGVTLVGNRFIARYLKDASSQVEFYDLTGEHLGSLELPGLGTAVGFGGLRSQQETFYSFTSFLTPGTVYRLDLTTGESQKLFEPQLPFAAEKFEVRQVFYPSLDGTRVPMFLVHRRGIAKNGMNPTLLYGYGGFNIAITPSFSPRTIAWLELGGIYAVANLRGGSEYGETWHQAGMLKLKQNVFNDFIAAAQWLMAQGLTSPKKLAIHGASNGGLLVGAVMTQRPELFAAAVPAVGVLDMLRYDKFTIGWAWASEYGSADDPEMFPVLFRYSPLHNLKPGTRYPATLILTADHDDRVVPAHSFKFAAALQAAQGGDAPVLIRIETKAGHGAGKPTSKLIEETADMLAFLTHVLHVPAATDERSGVATVGR